MNILLYSNTFLPLIGGREIVVHYLARSLQQLGHHVRVTGPSGWWRHRKLHFDYPVHRWPTLRGALDDEVRIFQLKMECAFWKTDIIHAHNTYPCGYFAAKVCAERKIPLLITPHGMDIHVIPELGFGHRLDPVKREKIGFALKRASLTTAISENIKASLNDAGVSDEKIRPIPNGIDLERFQRKIDLNVRKHYQLDENAQLILSVGNYHKRKGLEFLIQAMPDILQKNPDVRLLIVGRSDDVLKQYVRDLDLNGKVILTGPIAFPALVAEKKNGAVGAENSDLLAAIYLQSDLYASAAMNEGAEGLSLALLDATAAGLPIVATDISGNRDIVQDGVNGLLIKAQDTKAIADAVIQITTQPQLKTRMAQNALKIATEFSWLNIARKYADTYSEIIETYHL